MVLSCKDRTQEFFSTVEILRKQQSSKSSTAAVSARPSDMLATIVASNAGKKESKFTEVAKTINNGIMDVATKLEQLGKLAKGKSLFNDQSAQISSLTNNIKKEMKLLYGEVEDLEKYVETSSSSRGQSVDHSKQVVSTLKRDLESKFSQFNNVLTTQTKTLKEKSDKKQQYSSIQHAPLNMIRKRPTNVGSELFDSDGTNAAAENGMVQDNVMLLETVDRGNEYLESRVKAVQDIESTIQELSQMYGRLATIVKEQEEAAVRLDLNMGETLLHTENAHAELTKYYDWAKQNRWLMIKVFALLIFFAMIFVMFIQ